MISQIHISAAHAVQFVRALHCLNPGGVFSIGLQISSFYYITAGYTYYVIVHTWGYRNKLCMKNNRKVSMHYSTLRKVKHSLYRSGVAQRFTGN
jgi:hypothetical protein